MTEHELCCGTVANKAKLLAEIAERDRVIAAQQRRIGELAAQVERLRSVMTDLQSTLEYADNGEGCYIAGGDLMIAIDRIVSETPPAALAALKAQWQAEAFDHPVIEASMKAGCIGEFSFMVEGAGICPICAEDGFDRDCETCDGSGFVDLTVEVPWDVQKAIFKSMCKYKAVSIRQRTQEHDQ